MRNRQNTLLILLCAIVLSFCQCKKEDYDGLSECAKKIIKGNEIMLQKLDAYAKVNSVANCKAADAAMLNQLKVLEECKGESGATQADIDELRALILASDCE